MRAVGAKRGWGKAIIEVDSREQVDKIVRLALENGGTRYRDKADHGWMYYDSFADLDGHQWEVNGSFGFDFEAVYIELVPGDSFTYEFGGRFASVRLIEKGGATEISVVFDPETENPIEMQKSGWQAILNNFKNYTEAN